MSSFVRCPVGRASVVTATFLLGSLVTSRAEAQEPLAPSPPTASEGTVPATPARSVYTEEGALGAFRAGPSFGVGVPDGLRFGAFAKWRGLLGGGVAVSVLPSTNIPGIDAQITRASGEIFARVHPFRSAFFVGVAGGYAQTKVAMSDSMTVLGQPRRLDTRAVANAFYFAPNAGFQWMLPIGMTIGFDVGVEIPLGAKSPTIEASANGVALPADQAGGGATEAGRYVATMPVPVIHLLDLGFAL